MTDVLIDKVYIDWDRDGSFATAGDDISAYWMSTQLRAGLMDPDKHCAAVGTCTIQLRNSDKRFSPDYAAGPLSGKLLPYLPVNIMRTDGVTAWEVFRGVTKDWIPESGPHAERTCTLEVMDGMGVLQGAQVNLPLQIEEEAGDVLQKVTSLAYAGDVADGDLSIDDEISDGTTLTIGETQYTLKTTLSGASDEIKIGHPGGGVVIDTTAVHIAAALNADTGAGTAYGVGTALHRYVTAEGSYGTGWGTAKHGGWVALRDVAANNEALSVLFNGWQTELADDLPFDEIWIEMCKVGNPTGTLTIRIETPGGSLSPSGTLFDTLATGTISEASLSAAGGWAKIALNGTVRWKPYAKYHVVITTDRASSATNYVEVGRDAATGGPAYLLNKAGGVWSAVTSGGFPTYGIFWIPGKVTLTANARGAWGNDIATFAEAFTYHATSATLTVGTAASGALSATQVIDANYYVIAETSGTPGFNVEIDFTISGTGLHLQLAGRYQGNPAHVVTVDAWNGATWDTLQTLASSGSDTTYLLNLTSSHTIAGNVKIRFYHSSAGNATHRLYLDGLHVFSDTPSVPSVLTFSGNHLTGGTDAPSGLVDFDDGQVLPLAGDSWNERTNGLTAAENVADSEYGMLWCARNGTLTFRDYLWFFEQLPTAAALTLNDQMNKIDPKVALDGIANEVVVEYIPRRQSAAGVVIATANGAIEVPARSGSLRHNLTTTPGITTVKLINAEGSTGKTVGATAIIAPVAGTDYTVWTEATAATDSTTKGRNFTSYNRISVSLAINGGVIEATFKNTAARALFVQGFQVRGTALIAYDRQQVRRVDEASSALYGRRTMTIRLPFPTDRRFAEAVADYELSRRKTPRSLARTVSFRNQRVIGSTNLYSLDLGDVIAITESQTGLNGVRYMIVGWSTNLNKSGMGALNWTLRRMDDPQTWILGDANYSQLGNTTVLGL